MILLFLNQSGQLQLNAHRSKRNWELKNFFGRYVSLSTSSNYLDSISDGDDYSDNGLVSEEEILKGFQRVSDDELLSEEELDQVQYVRDFNIIYNEHNS